MRESFGPDAEILRLHDSDLTADPARITVELTTGSLFGGTKIVWLTALPAKAHGPLAEIASRPLDSAYLAVQAPDLKKSHKLAQAFEAAPYLAAIPSYGENQESVSAAIRRQAQSAGYEIAADAAALVAVRCDFSALLARSEMEKLMTYAGLSRQISLADVEACLADQQTAGLSEIVDHALNGEDAMRSPPSSGSWPLSKMSPRFSPCFRRRCCAFTRSGARPMPARRFRKQSRS